MGSYLSYPIRREPTHFNDTSAFTIADLTDNFPTEEISEKLFADALREREYLIEIREKFRNLTYEEVRERYPDLPAQEYNNIRGIFMIFDVNGDGLIDFYELGIILDEVDNKMTWEERLASFKAHDFDDTGAIDFEEFINIMVSNPSDSEDIAAWHQWAAEARSISDRRRLSVRQQITHGLF